VNRLLTPQQVAAQLQVPVSQVYNLHRTGRLPSLRIGKYVRFDEAAVAYWLASQNGHGPRA
jgi:excisionase family DNA binding protein